MSRPEPSFKFETQNNYIKMQKQTGALYTSEGQVIVAVYDPMTGDAWFNDQSRGICGYCKLFPELSAYDAWRDIWACYSYHKYHSANTYRDQGVPSVGYYDPVAKEQQYVAIDLTERIA
jgi:hypothetical protein